MKKTFPILLCTLLGQLGASAQSVRYITNLFDSGAGSFRSEVGLALPGDTIRFQVTGTIMLINGAIVYNKDLVIDGPGMDQLAISGGGQSSVLIIQGHSSWISGLSLVDGQVSGNLTNGGPGLRFTGDTLVLDSVRIANCTNSSGGGTIFGGGARIEALRLRMTGCVVENNLLHSAGSSLGVGPRGGGAYIEADSVRMVNCAFLQNTARQTNVFAGDVNAKGGGICLEGAARLTGCTIDGNTVEARCTYLSAYYANSAGGGIAAGLNSDLEMIDCSISHNTMIAQAVVDWMERGQGAGIEAYRTGLRFYGCTITGNVVDTADVSNPYFDGGGIYLDDCPLLMQHCVVDSNSCNNGSAIYTEIAQTYTGPKTIDISHSRISNNTGSPQQDAVVTSGFHTRLQLIDVEFSGNLHNSLAAVADTNRLIGCLFAENAGQVYLSNATTNENLIVNTTFTRSSSTEAALRAVNTNLTMINCTMVDDSLTGPGARELSINNSVVQMKNTILAETFFHGSSAFGQTGGAVISLGGNVCVDGSLAAYLTQPTDANNTQPGMGTFADHGGTTRTWSLLPTSTCIDRGGPDTLTVDQRGFLRDADSDAGAFEFGAGDPAVVIVSISADQIVCEGQPLDLNVSATSGTGLDHQWFLNGVAIAGATSANYSAIAVMADSGAYTCAVWNALDSVVVGPVMVDVQVCTGGSDHGSTAFRFFPNPTDEASGLFIEAPADAGLHHVGICDAQGRPIRQQPVNGADRVHIPLHGLAPGSYTLQLRWRSGVVHHRFVVH